MMRELPNYLGSCVVVFNFGLATKLALLSGEASNGTKLQMDSVSEQQKQELAYTPVSTRKRERPASQAARQL